MSGAENRGAILEKNRDWTAYLYLIFLKAVKKAGCQKKKPVIAGF